MPFKTVRIEKLPAGWTGKNYAMFTGSKAATGDYLLFTDADTTHQPPSILTAVACALERKIDLLTLAPETECRSFWEHVVQPLAVSSLALWFDPVRINDPRSPVVLANGQFILIRKAVYEKTGGNEAVRSDVVEDVELAKRVRRAGFLVQFLNGSRLYSTRMYTSLGGIVNGWTRIFTYLFEKKTAPIARKIFMFVFFSILPFALSALECLWRLKGASYFDATVFSLSLGVSGGIVLVRFGGNRMTRTNPWAALSHPLGSLVMVWILSCAIGRIVFNRPSVWRGQQYR